MGIKLGIYEKAMPASFTFEQKLLMAKKAGFDSLEISIDETEQKLARLTDSGLSDEILNGIRNTGLPVSTMCLSGHRKFPLGGENVRSLEIMKGALELACKLGIGIIQLAGYDVYYEPSTKLTEERFLINLRVCADMAAEYGILLGFETMETDFMNTVQKAMKYVQLINSPYLQIYPDIGNISNATTDYIDDINSGAGHIIAAHLKETMTGIYRELEYGMGRVDFEGFINALYTQGVRKYTCEFWYDGHTDPYEYIIRNKNYVTKIFARY